MHSSPTDWAIFGHHFHSVFCTAAHLSSHLCLDALGLLACCVGLELLVLLVQFLDLSRRCWRGAAARVRVVISARTHSVCALLIDPQTHTHTHTHTRARTHLVLARRQLALQPAPVPFEILDLLLECRRRRSTTATVHHDFKVRGRGCLLDRSLLKARLSFGRGASLVAMVPAVLRVARAPVKVVDQAHGEPLEMKHGATWGGQGERKEGGRLGGEGRW